MSLSYLQLTRPDSTCRSVMVISLQLKGLWCGVPQCPCHPYTLNCLGSLWSQLEIESTSLNEELSSFLCLFQFGGKLVTFGLTKAPGQQIQQTYPHEVFISQVTTETEFLLRSRELQMALQSGNLLDYCQGKIQTAKLPFDENLWNFLKVGWLWWNTNTSSFRVPGWNVFIMVLSSPSYLGFFKDIKWNQVG